MNKPFYLILFLIFFSLKANAQTGFHFNKSNIKSQKVSFKLINNLIVIPLEINGKELSFILDTGVNKTILFNLYENDSINLLNTSKLTLRGLGRGKPVNALLSKKNTFKIKNLISNNETVHVILKDFFDLSSKMGMTIHGIIGYRLLKNFIIKVNYKTKKLTFYNQRTFKYRKCKKCETIPFTYYRKKPFIDVKISLATIGNALTDVKLLVDSGGSDAIWLFEDTKEVIKTPKRFFNNLLGEGLSGPIYGNRSRITKFKLGRFQIDNPTVSFLDETSTYNARKYKARNGSLGGGILKRFKIWIDYPNRKFTFKKNGSFTKGFNYNMTGLDVVYNGKQLVKEENFVENRDAFNQKTNQRNSISFVTQFSFKFKPSFKIREVILNSPAYHAGLLKGDIILKINNKLAHEFTMAEILQKFQEKDKKKIRMTVLRNGLKLSFEFRLEKKV